VPVQGEAAVFIPLHPFPLHGVRAASALLWRKTENRKLLKSAKIASIGGGIGVRGPAVSVQPSRRASRMSESVDALVSAWKRGLFAARPDLHLAAYKECSNGSRHRLPVTLDAETRAFLEAGRRLYFLELRMAGDEEVPADAVLAWELVGLGPVTRAATRRRVSPRAVPSPRRVVPVSTCADSAESPVRTPRPTATDAAEQSATPSPSVSLTEGASEEEGEEEQNRKRRAEEEEEERHVAACPKINQCVRWHNGVLFFFRAPTGWLL